MKSLSDLEYVELYAKKLKQDSRYFKQQKMLIDSQIIASRSLFRAMFAGSDFKQKA
ncbi:hypothetical protein HYU12_05140, partial [Candidatus Woesearchaeota archaeon]|nr:hypothetical protein [Candidatus Woesearchaeota archaeon]